MQNEGTEPLDWEGTTETPWLSTAVITGTTPATLGVTANISGLNTGVHEGELTLRWADFCHQIIPVTVQVDPAQSELPAGYGRPQAIAKRALLQAETVEFVIVVTLKPVDP